MVKNFLIVCMAMLTLSGCNKSDPAQQYYLEIILDVNDSGVSHMFNKIIDYDLLKQTNDNIGFYECIENVGGVEYRISFWPAYIYPPIDVPAITINYYSEGANHVQGVLLAGRPFIVGSRAGWMNASIWTAEFLQSLIQQYPDQYPNNLDCTVIPR